MKSLILFFSFCVFTHKAISQKQRYIITDSIAILEARQMTNTLNLDSNQTKIIFLIINFHLNETENIRKSKGINEERIAKMKDSRKRFIGQLKTILTDDQFNQYKVIRQLNKNNFISREKLKNVQVKPLDDNE